MQPELTRRGRCHVFGNEIPLDEGFIPFDMAIRRIEDPAQLTPELFKMLDPEFPHRVRAGDIVIAGHNFGCGKPHFQGFIAMAAMNLSVLCTSMPYKSIRGAISKGVPVMTGVSNDNGQFATGDEIEVNFSTGEITNMTRGTRQSATLMSSDLVSIIQQGGTQGVLAAWLAQHPEMALGQSVL